MQNFRAMGAPPPDHVPPAAGALPPTPVGLQRLGAPLPDPQISPPIANFWLRAWLRMYPIKSIEYACPQKILATRANLFLQSSSLFSARLFLVY